MSLGQHAVVVEPARYSGSPDELAQRLATVLRVPPTRVAGMLERGPVTVDADLDEMAAKRLLKRLDSLGIPADLRDATGAVLLQTAAGAAATQSDDDDLDDLMSAVSDIFDGGMLDDIDIDIEIEDEASPEPVAAPQEEPGQDAWGAVLGNGAESSPPATESPAVARAPDPVDERSASLIAQFEATARQTDEQVREEPEVPSPESVQPAPTPPARPATPRPAQPPSAGPRQPPSTGPRQPASTGPKTPPVQDREPPKDRAFDGGLIAAALTDTSNKPPYAPVGFDSDPPHIPHLAAALSLVAPGAGQIYNGDDDDALDYGLRFFLIAPWVKSVQNALRRGEKVATYWLPRPDDGALLRALKYMLGWWFCVGAIIGVTWFFGALAWDRYHREPIVEITEDDIRTAMEDARTEVRLGRIAAMQALSEAQLSVPEKRFTMSDEERAERLFIIGYQHCQSRNFGSCESIMRRVASLKQGNAGQAFRLQAWASTALSGNVGKFPEVEGIRTLNEFEAAEMSEQLGVPAPPVRKPKPAPAAGPDAGPDARTAPETQDAGATP